MAEETPQAEAAGDGAGPQKGKSKLLLIVGVVVVLGGGGGAAWFLGMLPFGHKAEAKEEVKEAVHAPPDVGAILPLDPFIANLGDEDGKRYLKATLQVEFFEPKVPDEFQGRSAQMRDLLLTLFTSKTFAEVRTPEGKAVLREEIINRMNRTLHKDLVKAVYFTEFIVQ